MSLLYTPEDINLLGLNVPGVYVRIIRPPGYIIGQPTNAAAILGTASWGPLNTPTLVGSPTDAAAIFGGSSVVGASDPHDLCSEANIAFAQAQNPVSQQQWLTRISDGTDLKAKLDLLDTTSGTAKNLADLEAIFTGILGNSIKVHIANGGKVGSFNVVLIPPSPLEVEQFPNIMGGGAGVFAANLASAINSGINGFRGPSKLVRCINVDATSIDPALVTGTPLAGGTDGRAVDTADFLGSDSVEPKTGIYSLRGLSPVPTIMWCAGLTDNAATPTIQAFVKSEGMMGALNTTPGTSVASVISTRRTVGVDDPLVFYTKDHAYYYDSTPGVTKTRLVQPTPFIAGRIAALSPEFSPTNKPVYECLGTERVNQFTGGRAYAPSDIGQLHDNGCMIIHNPVPGGNYFGLPHGNAATTDAVRAPIEWARMTNFLAHSIYRYMGQFVGENQSTRTNDPLRAMVKAALDEFLQNLKDNFQIDDFKVVCDKSNNPDAMIARHFLKVNVYVRYMSSVQYIVVDLQGGTTVITVQNTLQDGLAA